MVRNNFHILNQISYYMYIYIYGYKNILMSIYKTSNYAIVINFLAFVNASYNISILFRLLTPKREITSVLSIC